MGVIKKAMMLAAALLLALTVGCSQHQEVMRLHVVANSDSASDQAIKLEVRDGLYAMLGGELAATDTAEEADRAIENNSGRIKQMAEDIIRENGQDYSAEVKIGEYDFPEKTYAGTVYPAGRYKAVRIVLGDGQGQNWWCVMFPPLCFIDIGQEHPDAQSAPQSGPVEFKSLLKEWYEELFGGSA